MGDYDSRPLDPLTRNGVAFAFASAAACPAIAAGGLLGFVEGRCASPRSADAPSSQPVPCPSSFFPDQQKQCQVPGFSSRRRILHELVVSDANVGQFPPAHPRQLRRSTCQQRIEG